MHGTESKGNMVGPKLYYLAEWNSYHYTIMKKQKFKMFMGEHIKLIRKIKIISARSLKTKIKAIWMFIINYFDFKVPI